MKRLLPLLSLVLLVAGLMLGGRTMGRAAAPAFAWTDVAGKTYTDADLGKAKATVFVFSSTQCPIAGRYTPRLITLSKDYAPKGVRFFLVNSNTLDSREAVVRYARERKLPFPAVKDKGTELADRFGATATPEAVVVDATGSVRYLGRIDDDPDGVKIFRQDVREALDAVLAGKPVARPKTRVTGCQIFRDKPEVAAATGPKVTFAKDVAPILNANCVTCHRKGDVAPFSLETYEGAKVWASAVKDYTARRKMPPWKPVPGHGDFHDNRSLSDAQIATLARWADSGAPLGDAKQIPPAPKLPPPGEWPLGTPDVVARPAAAFHLEAEGRDVYRNFVLPIDFTEDRFVSAFDFMPENRAIVHHMIAYIDLGNEAVQRDGQESEPGWSVSGGGSGLRMGDWGDGWAPGMTPRRLPPGVAVRIPKGAKVVLQVHYHKTGKVETDRSRVALYYAKPPVKDVLRTFPLGTTQLALQPNLADQRVSAGFTLPFAATVYSVLPHMHMLGKEMKVTATLPDGTEKSLIWIKDWEFNWQMNYRYKQPLSLPAGTKIRLTASYDNTLANPNQPSNPPKLVTFGEQTNDEMCFAFIGFTIDGTARPGISIPSARGSL